MVATLVWQIVVYLTSIWLKDKPADQGLPVVHYSVIHNNGKGETVLFN